MKRFRDRVYGFIELPELCIKIIDTPEFQRLRNIKQLGFASYVYPSAVHNRFEHCIGTAWLSGTWLKHYKDTQPELNITNQDILAIQVAGLVHDIGHGPFSHSIERFFNSSENDFRHEEMSTRIFDRVIHKIDYKKYELEDIDITFVKECITGCKASMDASHPDLNRSIYSNGSLFSSTVFPKDIL